MKNDDINERISKNIQAQLLELLPEESIRQKVDYEIENFFKPKKNSYNNNTTPSEFALLVQEALTKQVKELVNSIFNSPEWKVEISEELELKIGSSLQKVLGVAPDALRDVVTREIAFRNASNLVQILTGAIANSGNYEIANAIKTYMDSNLRT